MLLLRRHALLGGVSGSGKSGGLNVLMGNLTACADVVIWAIDLKRGMELGPWASCIARLATTPAEARALLADAVAVLEARAAMLAATGQRVWEPSPDMPALVIIVDEYAELVDDGSGGHRRRRLDRPARPGGRGHLIAATQRPTQKAMGQGALRSQMDVRISFRVRERKDVELDPRPGHARRRVARPHPQRARQVPDLRTRARHSPPCPLLPRHRRGGDRHGGPARGPAGRHWTRYPSRPSPSAPRRSQTSPGSQPVRRHEGGSGNGPDGDRDAPEAILWAALSLAPDDGISVPELMTATGMGRRWVYYRLRELADAGRVVQTLRGTWRTAEPGGDAQ